MATTQTEPLTDERQILAHSRYLTTKYFTCLDTFRFLSIMAVIWHHTQRGVEWFPASDRGFLGVDFFFVISGFLIVTLILRERDRTGGISLRKFYMRRSLRIFPIFYGLLGAMALFFLSIKPNSRLAQPFFEQLPFQALYVSNFIVDRTVLFFTWSLSSEEQFYVVWPPVEKWGRRAVVPILFVVLAINQMINFHLLDRMIGDAQVKFNILQITFTPICLGVLLAHMLHTDDWFRRISRIAAAPWASVVWLSALILACNYPIPDLSGWPRLLIQVLMTLLLASCVVTEKHWLNPLLQNPVVRRIGVISYGMYLYHEFAAHAARLLVGHEDKLPPSVLFCVTSVITIAVSELSYRFYETPFLRLKDALSRRK